MYVVIYDNAVVFSLVSIDNCTTLSNLSNRCLIDLAVLNESDNHPAGYFLSFDNSIVHGILTNQKGHKYVDHIKVSQYKPET